MIWPFRKKPKWDGVHRRIGGLTVVDPSQGRGGQEQYHWKCSCGAADWELSRRSAENSFFVHGIEVTTR